MTSLTPARRLGMCLVSAGLALLTACGGGTSTSQRQSVVNNCSIKLEALRPPCPPGVNCTTASCNPGSSPNGEACSTMSQPNWNQFQTIAGNSVIAGVNLAVPWSSVETSQGVYDFSALDSQIAFYTTNYPGMKVNLMLIPISYSSNGNNPTGGVNYFTPQYVFSGTWASNGQVIAANGGAVPPPLDVVSCSGYAGNASVPNSGYPVVYEAPFYVAYQNFIAAVIQHYNSNSTIGYARFGLSVGDETDAYCTAETQALPAPNTFAGASTWEQYIGTMVSFEKSQNPKFQIMTSLNSLDTNPGPTLPEFEANLAVSNGFGFGSNGWRASDIQASQTNGNCTSDWCALFDQYAGQVPLELQTATPSDPTNSDPNNPTGSLVNLIPTAVQNHATILEIALPDLYTAFDPGYNPGFYSAYNASLGNACAQ